MLLYSYLQNNGWRWQRTQAMCCAVQEVYYDSDISLFVLNQKQRSKVMHIEELTTNLRIQKELHTYIPYKIAFVDNTVRRLA